VAVLRVCAAPEANAAAGMAGVASPVVGVMMRNADEDSYAQ
jgi:hypothetical protein